MKRENKEQQVKENKAGFGSTTHIMQADTGKGATPPRGDLLSLLLGPPMHSRMPWHPWGSARMLWADY